MSCFSRSAARSCKYFWRRLPLLPDEFVQRAQIFFQRLQLAVGLCERVRLRQRAFPFRARAGKLRQLFFAIFQIQLPVPPAFARAVVRGGEASPAPLPPL